MNKNKNHLFPAPYAPCNEPDRFVQMAPLIVAVTCRDGIALLAAHTPSSEDQEPLLYYDFRRLLLQQDQQQQQQQQQQMHDSYEHDDGARTDHGDHESDRIVPEHRSCHLVDIPRHFVGPWRIRQVDSLGTTLLVTGYRSDCDTVYTYCSSWAAVEREQLYMKHPRRPNQYDQYDHDDNYDVESHVKCMAQELSHFMAQCAVSERMRTLSCVALLVAPPRSPRSALPLHPEFGISARSSSSQNRGSIWLVDSTGAYRVHGHAVGGWMTTTATTTTTTTAVLPSKIMQGTGVHGSDEQSTDNDHRRHHGDHDDPTHTTHYVNDNDSHDNNHHHYENDSPTFTETAMLSPLLPTATAMNQALLLQYKTHFESCSVKQGLQHLVQLTANYLVPGTRVELAIITTTPRTTYTSTSSTTPLPQQLQRVFLQPRKQ